MEHYMPRAWLGLDETGWEANVKRSSQQKQPNGASPGRQASTPADLARRRLVAWSSVPWKGRGVHSKRMHDPQDEANQPEEQLHVAASTCPHFPASRGFPIVIRGVGAKLLVRASHRPTDRCNRQNLERAAEARGFGQCVSA